MSCVRDVVEVVARALAIQPDQVTVSETTNRGGTLIELHTAPGELGRVIGRQGRTANAIRALPWPARSPSETARRSRSNFATVPWSTNGE